MTKEEFMRHLKELVEAHKKHEDNLECCGNCKDYYELCDVPQGSNYCDKYQSDGMSREERRIK